MAPHKDWSYLTKEMLEDLYDQHGNWAEVCRQLGMERSVLLHVRRRLGIPDGRIPAYDKRQWRTGRLYNQKDEIVRMAQKGMNCGEIARQIGEPDPENVRQLLVRLGIPRQRSGARIGDKNPMWSGGRVIDQDGYILVKVHGHPFSDRHGYVREHRLVMEQKLGRLLLPTEVVHHKDGNRQNNQPENLDLFSDNGEHLKEEWSDPEWAEHQSAIRRKVSSEEDRSHRVSENGVPTSW